MEYGHFSKDYKEYIITRPDTPTPWINYLSNNEYCAMISNTAGGYSFHIDPRNRRITRYRYNNIPTDRPGRYLYIRDSTTGEYWSPTWQPTLSKLSSYECRHGLGYTKIISSFSGIESEITYFVPTENNLEIWVLTLKNTSLSEDRWLKVFSYNEFCLWNATRDQNDLQSIQFVGISRFNNDFILYHLFNESTGYAFFASNAKIESYDCSRESFIGKYRDESNPEAVEIGECFRSEAIGGNPIAATCSSVTLKPMESKTIIYILGVEQDKSKVKDLVKKFTNKETVDNEFQKLSNHWNSYLNTLNVETEDPDFDTMVNVWNQYQCQITFDWSRYVSFYETGIGRGMGFRDCSQDILGVVKAFPSKVRQRIIDLAKNQFEDGHVYHIYFPLTGEGGFPYYVKEDMKFFSDDHLWLIPAVAEYIKETGDTSILDEKVEFVDGPPGTIYEHMQKSIDFARSKMGNHDLPLLGTADWNDPLSIPGPNNAAESVFAAMLLHKSLTELSELSSLTGKETESSTYLDIASKTKDHLNKVAWDGDWFIRAFDDSGDPLGSKKCKEGKIYLNAQSWSVLSGVALYERGLKSMDAVKENLNTKYGLILLSPAYSRYYDKIGDLTQYAPGLKENASIWSHANAWAIIAECMLGRGDQAYEYFKQLAPPTKNGMASIHQAEPYVYAQTIAGKDHHAFGMAKQSWLTGTAAWMMIAATNWIIGVRPQYDGLLVDPCVPTSWRNFRMTRRFRDATYDITFSNPNGVSKGIKDIHVDGKPFESNLLPVFSDGKTHKISVTMG
ncbi:MAG: glycosyl transferase [Candidatus Thorarchaeota archaeon]|nr:MAG: glycosyl transferase [Candidatus Thorarchaeota archaeon]